MKSIAFVAAASVLLAPGVSLAQKSGAKPDFTLEPNYGSVRLETGFTPDPWTKSILAGGSIPASAAKSGCEGKVSAAPDLQLNYTAGDLDLTMTNGFVLTEQEEVFEDDPMRLWENDGLGRMTEASEAAGIQATAAGKGLLTFDYDRDGDLDIFVVNNAGEPHLFRNERGNESAWLRVQLIGTTSNRDALGARVVVEIDEESRAQVREAGASTHFLGQSETTLHFGLGTMGAGNAAGPLVRRITITWPASGTRTVLEDVPANRTIVVREGDDGFVRSAFE